MSEREPDMEEQISAEDRECMERLKREPGFYHEFAACLILFHRGEVVGTYRREELLSYPDDETIRQVISSNLAARGIDINQCSNMLTFPIQSVTVGVEIPINPDNNPNH